jgi:hypothetical protein
MDAGWHFSSVGRAEQIVRKHSSYAHHDTVLPDRRDLSSVEDLLTRIRHGEPEPGWGRCEIDAGFPAYVREHKDELADLIL